MLTPGQTPRPTYAQVHNHSRKEEWFGGLRGLGAQALGPREQNSSMLLAPQSPCSACKASLGAPLGEDICIPHTLKACLHSSLNVCLFRVWRPGRLFCCPPITPAQKSPPPIPEPEMPALNISPVHIITPERPPFDTPLWA